MIFSTVAKGRKKEILMTVSDFYNAVTPGSSITHGVGRGVYTIIDQDEVCSPTTYEDGKLPIKERYSVLNEVIKDR